MSTAKLYNVGILAVMLLIASYNVGYTDPKYDIKARFN